jgi:isoleucyl-tRNA synthetase
LLQRYAAFLPGFFIVSQVEVETVPANGGGSATGPGTLTIRAERALGSKCERCWNYSTHVGESADYPTFCERCVAALNEIEAGGGVLTGSPKS